MALRQIGAGELAGKGVLGLADVPGLTGDEMKQKFEEVVREVVIPVANANAADTYDKLETEQKIAEAVFEAGAADMQRAVYDTQMQKRDVFIFAQEAAAAALAAAEERLHSMAGSLVPFMMDAEIQTPFTYEGKAVYAIRKSAVISHPVGGSNAVDLSELAIEKVLFISGMQYVPTSTVGTTQPIPMLHPTAAASERGMRLNRTAAASGIDTLNILLPTGSYTAAEQYEITMYYIKTA